MTEEEAVAQLEKLVTYSRKQGVLVYLHGDNYSSFARFTKN
jgi:hypothetical protein